MFLMSLFSQQVSRSAISKSTSLPANLDDVHVLDEQVSLL